MPLYYDNTGGDASQTDRKWAAPQDWSSNGIETLIINFFGDPNNTGTSVFAEINGKKVTYPDNADLKKASWHQWPIDLAALGINLSAVTTMSIGVEGAGAPVDGVVLGKVDAGPALPVGLACGVLELAGEGAGAAEEEGGVCGNDGRF